MKHPMRTLAVVVLLSCVPTIALAAKARTGLPDVPRLAQQIDDSLRQPVLKNQELAVLTFVDQDRLDKAQGLGRYLQERLGYELFNLGYRIVEIRLGKTLEVREGTGETALSRLKDQLRKQGFTGLKGVVTGTYTMAGRSVYVQARLIDLELGQVRAMGELSIPLGKALTGLFVQPPSADEVGGGPDVYERFPSFPLPAGEAG